MPLPPYVEYCAATTIMLYVCLPFYYCGLFCNVLCAVCFPRKGTWEYCIESSPILQDMCVL